MEERKQLFVDLAYSKFGIKATGKITMQQAFEILDDMEQTKSCNCYADQWAKKEDGTVYCTGCGENV